MVDDFPEHHFVTSISPSAVNSCPHPPKFAPLTKITFTNRFCPPLSFQTNAPTATITTSLIQFPPASPHPVPDFWGNLSMPGLNMNNSHAPQHGPNECVSRPTKQVHHPERNMLVDSNLSKQEQLSFIEKNVVGNSVQFSTPFGQRQMTYADYTASGRSLQFIEGMIMNSVLPFYANTHTTSSRTGRQTSKFREEARAMVCASVNAQKDKDVVLFCGSGSTAAISKLLLKLQKSTAWQTDLRAGRLPLVVVGPHEHHSNILPWRESGAKVVQCNENSSGLVDLAHLEQILTQNSRCSFKAGSFSAGSNVTGVLCPVDSVASLLHRHRALAFFDYAAAGPYIPIDVNHTAEDSLSYLDAIFLSPHKFVGVLVCKRQLMLASGLIENEAPTAPGGGTVLFVSESSHRYVDVIEEREEGGTPDIIGAVRCGLVFRLKDEVTAECIEGQEKMYVEQVLATWGAHERITVLGPADAERLSILSFLISSPETKTFLHHNFVCALLNDLFGLQARSGCACAGPYVQRLLSMSAADAKMLEATLLQGDALLKPGFTRVNLNYFLPPHIISFIIEAVCFVADHAHSFLPLYTCSSSGEWSIRPLSSLSPSVLALLPPSSSSLSECSLEDISPLLSSLPSSSSSPVTPAVIQSYMESARALSHALTSLARQSPSPLDACDPSFCSPEASAFLWFLVPSSALAITRGANHDTSEPRVIGKLLPASVFGRPQASANTPAIVGAELQFPHYVSYFELFAAEQMEAAKSRAVNGAEPEGGVALGVEGAREAMREAARKWRDMPADERARFGTHLPGVGLVALRGPGVGLVALRGASGSTAEGQLESQRSSTDEDEDEARETRQTLAEMTESFREREAERKGSRKGSRAGCFPRLLGRKRVSGDDRSKPVL